MREPTKPVDIRKSAGVIIRDKKLLVVRSHGKDVFMAPGGKIEAGENAEEALVRELGEELGVEVSTNDMDLLGTYYALAGGHADKQLEMHVYMVRAWQGEITPQAEITELQWVDSVTVKEVELTTIFRDEVLPRLVKEGRVL
jgi:mutator protein MutT